MFDETQTGGAPAAMPTVRTFAPAFLADCAERWKPATRRSHAHGMKRHILPALGDRRVDALTAKDVRNWFDDLAVARAGTANRALAVLSAMMQHAETLGLRHEDSNPCKGLRRRKSGFKAHYLTDDEFAALGRALDAAEADWPVAVAGLLGHADIATTFGYAHLAEDSVFDAANRVSRGLADMLDGGEAGR